MNKKSKNVRFSEEIFDLICGEIATGRSLLEICEEDGMPSRRAFVTWAKSDPELQKKYDLACLDREEVYFEQIVKIADEPFLAEKRVSKADGGIEITEYDLTERSKIQIDARKWCLARMNRKKYGDKVGIDGGEDGSPLVVKIVRHGDE